MRQLRPHLVASEFVAQVRRQAAQGYQIACVVEDNAVRAVAGFRILESLSSGKFLYVDDLATDEPQRSKRHGQTLFDWLVNHARASGCQNLELDSGVQRFAAHRFYLRNRMDLSSHHFRLDLRPR